MCLEFALKVEIDGFDYLQVFRHSALRQKPRQSDVRIREISPGGRLVNQLGYLRKLNWPVFHYFAPFDCRVIPQIDDRNIVHSIMNINCFWLGMC